MFEPIEYICNYCHKKVMSNRARDHLTSDECNREEQNRRAVQAGIMRKEQAKRKESK